MAKTWLKVVFPRSLPPGLKASSETNGTNNGGYGNNLVYSVGDITAKTVPIWLHYTVFLDFKSSCTCIHLCRVFYSYLRLLKCISYSEFLYSVMQSDRNSLKIDFLLNLYFLKDKNALHILFLLLINLSETR